VSESKVARSQGDDVHHTASVATPDEKVRAARLFWSVWACVLAIKLALSARLAPFGDEAFYWQESRHLDWAYSDLPPFTALLIRAGESLCGHGEFGLRLLFVLLGAAIPLLLRRMAARHFGVQLGDVAGTLWLLLPLGATLGLLALPDVPLLFACAWALTALDAALANDRRRDWLALGVALALAWVTHYRAAMLVFAGLCFFISTPRGRACWRRPGLWLALATSLLGLVPVVVFNQQHAWQGLAFQLIERHPWRFHADAFVQPLEQALACTPLLYFLLVWALWRSIRSRDQGAPWDLFGIAGSVFVLGYFLLGLFADDLRFRAHWPLPGYIPAVLALPLLARGKSVAWQRWLWRPACALAALGSVAAFAYFLLAASPAQTERLAEYKVFPENFVGWHEAGARTRDLLGKNPSALLVADNFLLAAELDFQLGGRVPVFVLDHPLNTKHGRAPQLAQWRVDEAALAENTGREVLLVVEDTAGRERERQAWQDTLPRRIAGLQRVESLELFGARKRFSFYRGRVPPPS
jgi:4-amino-4-deoxy-L-arabinose transferase-like glycosyltransferase